MTPRSTQRFVLSDEEHMVQAAASAFVADRMPTQNLRAVRDTAEPGGFDRAIWTEMAALGWPGIAVPEIFGGVALGARAATIILEELGKTLGAAPFGSTALVAAKAIGRFAEPSVAARWLPAIARGEILAALAIEEGAYPHAGAYETKVDAVGARIKGDKSFVADGVAADLFLVAVQQEGAFVLALVRRDAPGVSVRRIETIDGRGMAEVAFRDTPVEALLVESTGCDPIDYALDCARIGLGAEMLGASSRALEVTLEYLRIRRQFGHAIGAFQALQHRAAKLFIEIELTRSCVFAAADALHNDAADLALLASLAKAAAGELMRAVSYEMIQLHGGIGMTDAHDAGLYLKRGRVAALLYGDSAFHRDRYATLKRY